jgi:hypothetical protein
MRLKSGILCVLLGALGWALATEPSAQGQYRTLPPLSTATPGADLANAGSNPPPVYTYHQTENLPAKSKSPAELPTPKATAPPGLSPEAEKATLPVVQKAFNPAGMPPATPADNHPLPINLATTLRLANVR